MNIKIDTRQKVITLLDVHTANELVEVYNFLRQLDGWEQYKILSLESDDVRIKEFHQFGPIAPNTSSISLTGDYPYRVFC